MTSYLSTTIGNVISLLGLTYPSLHFSCSLLSRHLFLNSVAHVAYLEPENTKYRPVHVSGALLISLEMLLYS